MGLTKAEIPGYWAKRGARYAKDLNWGLGARTVEEHKAQVEERAAFIFETCPRNLDTLDFGCGIGMYSRFFLPDRYIGVDICEPHLEIARRDNPDYGYRPVRGATSPESYEIAFAIFFTATVLQHCADDVVDGIFEHVAANTTDDFVFSIYEYASPNWTSRQTVGRTPDEYTEMVAQYFHVIESKARHHTIHGTDCAHSMIYVKPKGE